MPEFEQSGPVCDLERLKRDILLQNDLLVNQISAERNLPLQEIKAEDIVSQNKAQKSSSEFQVQRTPNQKGLERQSVAESYLKS
jgi:hypothetical protein